MISLPNGCRYSELAVTPKNWKDKDAELSVTWMVHYRFYDPTFEKPHHERIKAGLNQIKDLRERQATVRLILQQEEHRLKVLGFNPLTNTYAAQLAVEYEIDPETPLIEALNKALEKITVGHRTRIGIKSVITGVEKAARQLRLSTLPISKVSRRHLKMILSQCGENSKKWSPGRFNLYRAYLLMLFKELVELEAVTANPVRDISKQAVVQKIKTVLTEEQRSEINRHLRDTDPHFYHFVHLFFHSGGRKPELLQLKPGDVDLRAQKYRCIVKKGKKHRQVERTIKTVAIPYWEYFLAGCPEDQFIFGTNFRPGKKPMGVDTPTRVWQRLVKDPEKGLGIDVDFYSLKHLNTSEVVDLLDEEAAAELNKHTSTAMVVNIYDVRQKDRQHQRLKGLNNQF